MAEELFSMKESLITTAAAAQTTWAGGRMVVVGSNSWSMARLFAWNFTLFRLWASQGPLIGNICQVCVASFTPLAVMSL